MSTTTSAIRSIFRPPVLTSENYDVWQGKVMMLLKSERLWSIVSGKRLRPEGGSDGRPTKGQSEWDDDAECATALIFLCLGNMAEQHVMGIEDPVEVWNKLKEVYLQSGFSAQCSIWVRLFSAQLTDHTIEKYVNEIGHCCQLLRGAGFEVPEEIQCSALIQGLDQSYEPFVTSISQLYRRKENIKFEELVSQLFDEHRRMEAKINEGEPYNNRTYSTAMHIKGRKPLVCWHCKKEGHKEENCWEKYPEKRPKEAIAKAGLVRVVEHDEHHML